MCFKLLLVDIVRHCINAFVTILDIKKKYKKSAVHTVIKSIPLDYYLTNDGLSWNGSNSEAVVWNEEDRMCE